MPNLFPITDFADPALDVYARLTENQLVNREDLSQGLFIAESPKVIERALNAGYVPVSFLMEPRHVETQARDILARCGEVPVYTAPLDVLKQLTGFPLTRGMLCAMRRRPLPAVETVCVGAKRVAVLEDVMNPTNVGAIFRSAAVERVAARLPEGWPQTLRALGFTTAAMALCDASLPIYAPQLKRADRLAVVLGTEGDGLAESTIAACDCTVRIPMMHGVDSLNVAAASAVAFYQLALLAGLSETED